MSSFTELVSLNTSVYVGCSVLALFAVAVWIWLRIKHRETLRHEELNNVHIPPTIMRKAPPPTLPDAIRLLTPKREVYAEPASILNISGGIPTLNQRSKTFEKVMKDIPCISYHDDDVKSRQPLMSPKTYNNSSVVFIPYSNNNEIAEST